MHIIHAYIHTISYLAREHLRNLRQVLLKLGTSYWRYVLVIHFSKCVLKKTNKKFAFEGFGNFPIIPNKSDPALLLGLRSHINALGFSLYFMFPTKSLFSPQKRNSLVGSGKYQLFLAEKTPPPKVVLRVAYFIGVGRRQSTKPLKILKIVFKPFELSE